MPTPQQLLDSLHSINIQSAWDTGLIAKERGSLIKLHRQKLKAAKQVLRQEQDIIKKRYDGRNKTEAAIESALLRPYTLIDQLIGVLEESLNELQHANEFDRLLPSAPRFGQIFYGGPAYGSYIVADRDDLKRVQQELLQQGREFRGQIKALEDKKMQLKNTLTDEATIKSVSASVKNQSAFWMVLFLVLCAEMIGVMVLVGTSAVIPVSGAVVVTVVLMFITGASVRRLTNTTLKPYLATLANIGSLDKDIAAIEESYNQTKMFYDEAKEGLKRIAALQG